MANHPHGNHDALFDAARSRLGISNTIDHERFESILDPFDMAASRYGNKPAFSCLGHTLTFMDVDQLSDAFASYLKHHTGLQTGDRIAIQLPNVLQYPVAIYGALKAGLIIVNTNPLYTPREMEHQFNDSGAKAIVILANMAAKLEQVLPATAIQHVIITEMADLHPAPKRWLLNAAVKYLKKMVPSYRITRAVRFTNALKLGRVSLAADKNFRQHQAKRNDIAVLQYTGGTTGVAKGAMLTHGNLLANMLQVEPILRAANLRDGEETFIAPLPLYHIYAFMLHGMTAFAWGCHSVLIPNPRDINAFITELGKYPFQVMVGLNTLFIGLLNHPGFRALDFSSLRITLSGGMALSESVAREWEVVTGCKILEGYGLTETSPVVCINPPQEVHIGTIGLPLPATYLRIIDAEGREQAIGEAGELCVRGPQVMPGYWQRPDATAETIKDQWLQTGDIASIDADGYVRIVDRKKDMILVSGFNVYPNEVENVVNAHPGVLESAVIGIPDAYSGELVKLFVVRKSPDLTEEELMGWCRQNLTGYKCPKWIEFRDALPKSNVGKILRRELR